MSGRWFQRKISKNVKTLQKITNNSIKIVVPSQLKTNLVGVHHRNTKTKFATNLWIGLRDGEKWVKQRSFIKRENIGHRFN